MEILLRLFTAFVSFLIVIINTVLNFCRSRQKPTYPPITNKLLTKSVSELVVDLRLKKVTSEQLVQAYISRIQEVNPSLNAVIEDRYEEALKDAKHADKLIAKCNNEALLALFSRYPLLGIPCTVKESCGVKGLSFAVGNYPRMNKKCPVDSEVVEQLRSAGCIPLLVSANPEFCLSYETNTHTHGRCLNPYDLGRTSGGSSGGEGALNGAGASLFGLGSDIAGSIRLPALYCGVFGHKPTGGLLPVKGHFPNSYTDKKFPKLLQMGPITRFARDLPLLLTIMAGSNAEKLNLMEVVPTKDIKIYYAFGFEGINLLTHAPVSFDIKLAIKKAVKCFEKGGMTTREVSVKGFQHCTEIGLSDVVTLEGVPSILTQSSKTKPSGICLIFEMLKCLIGHSIFTKDAIFMELMQTIQAFIPSKNMEKWRLEAEALKAELLELLGKDGVLFFPTFHTPAPFFNTSILNMVGIDYLVLFNILGFPATHIPMGTDSKGLPVGFQVIAAPYQDKLCFQIAAELEGAFGGWIPPIKNDL